ncbi:hypothetical protein EK0264_11685 [Epidermidibacterium keratini]|uniref:Uncharacterized protein n=1 Tax=Epidermidibacterium keratini TaxID=1891644 RepID=A0A7L4YNL8_9ACTN|nr:hypothetical protein [Epidermidibacterium keratini]QHC00881.1 hypothetical protein EK0264_11685 [Epidermidibacterium keratini]
MRAPDRVAISRSNDAWADEIRVPTVRSGLVLGTDRNGEHVVVPFFGADPREVVAVGGIALAKLLCFRALALGAQVWVETRRFSAWETFIRMAAGSSGAIRLVHDFPEVQIASEAQPSLVVIDSDATVAEGEQLGRPWVTILTLYNQLNQWNSADLPHADLAIFQKLSPAEAKIAASVLRLPGSEGMFTQIPDDVITMTQFGKARAARINQTEAEAWLLRGFSR